MCLQYHIFNMHRTALHPHQLWATVRSDQHDKVSQLAYLASHAALFSNVDLDMCTHRHQRPFGSSRHDDSSCRVLMTHKRRTLHAFWPLP